MINIESIKRGAVAAVAAIILTATTVGAAVGPAEAVASPAAYAALQADGAVRG